MICLSPFDDSFYCLKCNHFLCADCWYDYLAVKVEDFFVCLTSRCPQDGCELIIPEYLFNKYLKLNENKEKFSKYLLRNFTGFNSDLKLCPGLSCNYQ